MGKNNKKRSMTLNWGHKLTIVFLVFGGLMSFLVYRSVKTNFELVSKEYYKEEIAYQQVIDGAREAALLSSALIIARQDDSVSIRFPAEMNPGIVKGNAWFYYAPDAQRDRRVVIALDGSIEQKIPASLFSTGKYVAKVWWQHGGKQYYNEQTMTIQ
jgi:hypothetical protein